MRARLGRCLLASAALVAAIGMAAGPAPARSLEGDEAASQSLLGSYLSARMARSEQETGDAAEFYGRALQRDPSSEILLEQAFMTEAAQGNWPRAISLAGELAGKPDANRLAFLMLAVVELKAGHYDKADERFAAAASGAIGDLTSTLARAWVKVAAGQPDAALESLDLPRQAAWAAEYVRYQRALLADVAGKPAEAEAAFDQVFHRDTRSLRTALAYARHADHAGDFKKAKAILDEHIQSTQGEGHPLARALRQQVVSHEKIDLLVPNASEGVAEVLYGLGDALTSEGGMNVGMIYLQMALYLDSDHAFALLSLAQAYEASKKYAEANSVYDRLAANAALRTSIEVQKALNLASLDKVDEAKALLDKEALDAPSEVKVFDALGSIMRSRKRYAEAATYYTRAISLIGKPDKRHWAYFYARGTCEERLNNWPAAEADLKTAMRLSPDQPLVLNYLGYSWVDQNRNLKQGLALIEKAVQLKPDDGYIVDSLGWAHFKLNDYKEAVRHLERAVELKPDDPVLNDHLGDALWRVGREREARFQWNQALSLAPEPDDAAKIKEKLANGLTVPAVKAPPQAVRPEQIKRRETKLIPNPSLD